MHFKEEIEALCGVINKENKLYANIERSNIHDYFFVRAFWKEKRQFITLGFDSLRGIEKYKIHLISIGSTRDGTPILNSDKDVELFNSIINEAIKCLKKKNNN